MFYSDMYLLYVALHVTISAIKYLMVFTKGAIISVDLFVFVTPFNSHWS